MQCKFLLTCAVVVAAFSTRDATAQTLQLADGRVLLASVEDADGQGLRVHRLDNGGYLELRWDHLSAASATTWKKKFGLIGEGDNEILVRADEVAYLNKGTRQSVIGRIIDPSGDPLVVQAKGVTYPIPRQYLQGAHKVEVPATQVYTKDEFYQLRLDEIRPGDQAQDHMLLAEELIKFRDYDRAAEHLDKAKNLGNARDPQHLATLEQRLAKFKNAAKELGLLEAIQVARSRGGLGDFEKGRALIAQFEEQYPSTKLEAEFDREKDRFEKARTRFLTQKVADQWRRSIKTVAEKKIGDEKLTLEAARDYAENRMTDDIVDRLASSMNLEAQEVRDLWAQRENYTVGKRTEHFSYGIGSWVLGPEGILKDTKAGEQQAKNEPEAAPGQDREIEKFAKLLRQAMESRRRQAQGQGGEPREQTEEGWWTDASRAEQVNWLRAYYAEFGGQLVVKFATVMPCISCYGVGTTPEMSGEGKMTHAKCFLCQGTKWQRSFKAY